MTAAPGIALLAKSDLDPTIFIGLIGFAVFIFCAAFVYDKKREEARRRAIADWAAKRGAKLVVDAAIDAPAFRWPFFQTGRRRKVASVVERAAPNGGPRFRIFRFVFVTGGGKNKRTHRFVCAMTEEGAAAGDGRRRMPTVEVRPRRFTDTIGGWFGGGGMKFPDDPAFGDALRIDTDDESAAAAFLDRGLKSALLSDADPSWSGFGGGSAFVAIKNTGSPETYDDAERRLLRLHQAVVARLTR